MRAKEKTTHVKYTDLVTLAQKNPEKTAKVPAFERMMSNLATELAPVQSVENQAQQSTKGVTKEKNNTQSELKISVGRLANVMIGYASEAKNVAL